MYEFHKDKRRYFEMQYKTAKNYLLPFVERFKKLNTDSKILEIGCAEAGVLKAFTERGMQCTGIELMDSRVQLAKKFMDQEFKEGLIQFYSKNIYDVDVEKELPHKYDLIILKDVIEHIHDQDRFLKELHRFLKKDGVVFFGFPPWYMPFGGHQQICKNKFLGKLPYYHLLPRFLYKMMLKLGGESTKTIEDLLEIKDTGISLERFERLCKKNNYDIKQRKLFLFNPIYHYKFNLKVRKQNPMVAAIPGIRNFFTTAGYYLISEKSVSK